MMSSSALLGVTGVGTGLVVATKEIPSEVSIIRVRSAHA